MVITTMHQPSSQMFNGVDKIVLIGSSNVAFMGNRGQARQFFASVGHPVPRLYSPEQWYITCMATEGKSNYITRAYTESSYIQQNQQDVEEVIHEQKPLPESLIKDLNRVYRVRYSA